MISLSLADQKNSILGLDDLSEQQNSILSLDDLSELGGRLGHLPRPQDALLPLHQEGSDLGGSIVMVMVMVKLFKKSINKFAT